MVISRGTQPRGGNNTSQGKLFARAGSDRSVRTVNLSRLCKQIEPDILAAAILLREDLIRSYIQGKEQVRNEYAQEIGINLADAGFPADWLDTPNAPITPSMLDALRQLAASSTQKAPIRRENLKRLMTSFDGKLEVLADALEMIVPSLKNIANGSALLDEQRMGHLNPRLMSAGFPDGWLEHPTAAIDPGWLDNLTAQATDTYEKAIESEVLHEKAAEQKAAAREAELTSKLIASPVSLPIPKTNTAENTVNKTHITSSKVAAAAGAAPKSAKLPAGVARGKSGAGRLLPGGRPLPAATGAEAPAAKVKTTAAVASKVAVEKISKAQSMKRADALDTLMSTSRRGAKVCLWRELLGKSLPYSGNVKHGAIMLRDELAQEIADVLGLPGIDWFDNPSFPPATLSAWVTDKSIPLPASKEEAIKLAQSGKKKASKKAPSAVAPAPAPVAKVTRPKVAQAAQPRMAVTAAQMPGASAAKVRAMGSMARQTLPGKPITVAPSKVMPGPAHTAPAPTVVAPVVAAAPAPAALSPQVGFVWIPANDGSLAEPGPLAQALAGEIGKLSKAGSFTENDAVRMLYYLMECRK